MLRAPLGSVRFTRPFGWQLRLAPRRRRRQTPRLHRSLGSLAFQFEFAVPDGLKFIALRHSPTERVLIWKLVLRCLESTPYRSIPDFSKMHRPFGTLKDFLCGLNKRSPLKFLAFRYYFRGLQNPANQANSKGITTDRCASKTRTSLRSTSTYRRGQRPGCRSS